MLAGGASEAEIPRDFPDLETQDIRACLAYAVAQLGHPVVMAAEWPRLRFVVEARLSLALAQWPHGCGREASAIRVSQVSSAVAAAPDIIPNTRFASAAGHA
jgi:hypothetical protein